MEAIQQPINCRTASLHDLKTAYYSKKPISGIEKLGTHYGSHNDEIYAGFLLMTTVQGKQLFPGIENASFGSIGTTYLRQNGLLNKNGFFKAMQYGILLLGVGGGLLDEHGDRARRISCTQMVVTLLALEKEKSDRKIYNRLTEYVNFEDGNGDNVIQCLNRIRNAEKEMIPLLSKKESASLLALQIGALAQNLKKGFEYADGNPAEEKNVFAMAFQFYNNEVNQAKLFAKAEESYEKARKRVIQLKTTGKEHPFVLLELTSDIPTINKVVHSRWRDDRPEKLGVLFLQKTNGQFALMPNRKHFVASDMMEIAKILRQKAAYNMRQNSPIPFEELNAYGVIDRIPEIHVDEATGVISNGSKVDPEVPGLIGKYLSADEVIEAIQIGLDIAYFPKNFAAGCAEGLCETRKCPLYHFGLERCISVRQQNKHFAGLRKMAS